MPLVPELGKQRQAISEFEASLVYTESSRTAWAKKNKKKSKQINKQIKNQISSKNKQPTDF